MGRKFLAAACLACGILGCCTEPQSERFVTEGINPAFSPDGRRIAFQRLVEGEFHLGVVAATGGEVEWVENGPGMAAYPGPTAFSGVCPHALFGIGLNFFDV